MRDEHRVTESDDGDRFDPTGRPEPLASVASERLYDWLAGYGFARRYVRGKVAANVSREALGYGSHLLSQTAARVVGLTDATDAADLASYAHPAPNVQYREIAFPAIPYPEGYFDAVVALEELDRPEELVEEARRVLKPDGVLVISTPDKRALLDSSPEGEGRLRGMYVPEFRALLGQHFGQVRVFRRGAVAGGLVFPETEWPPAGASVESVPVSASIPLIGPEPPTTRSVLAVCSQTGALEGFAEHEQPYLLLDDDRLVFDEREDLARDADLLRSEIGRMEETEVQAFRDTYRLLFSEIAFLRAQVRRSEAQARQTVGSSAAESAYIARIRTLEDRIRAMENSATWRVFEPYRRLRVRLSQAIKDARGKK